MIAVGRAVGAVVVAGTLLTGAAPGDAGRPFTYGSAVASQPQVFQVTEQSPAQPRRVATMPSGHTVALTFDDGPYPQYTKQVLYLLDQHHVHAVFCEIGALVDSHPGLARRIVRSGNVLCDHTQHHDEHLASRSAQHIRWEIWRCRHAQVQATGTAPLFFRAPGGDWSNQVERIAQSMGMASLHWNDDPRDWARPGTRAIVHTTISELHPGAIVILHDGGGNRSETVAALRILLRRLPHLGYRFVLPRA